MSILAAAVSIFEILTPNVTIGLLRIETDLIETTHVGVESIAEASLFSINPVVNSSTSITPHI